MYLVWLILCHLTLLLSVEASSEHVSTHQWNTFLTPSADHVENSWEVGSFMHLEWSTTHPTYRIALYKEIQGEEKELMTIYRGVRAAGQQGHRWKIQTFETPPSQPGSYRFRLSAEASQDFVSASFNITRPEALQHPLAAFTPDVEEQAHTFWPRISPTYTKFSSDAVATSSRKRKTKTTTRTTTAVSTSATIESTTVVIVESPSPAPSSSASPTISPSSTPSATSTDVASSPVLPTTTHSSPTVPPSQTSTPVRTATRTRTVSPTAASPTATPSSTSDPRTLILSLAMGVGVGAPLIIGLGILLGFRIRRQRIVRSKAASAAASSSAESGADDKRGDGSGFPAESGAEEICEAGDLGRIYEAYETGEIFEAGGEKSRRWGFCEAPGCGEKHEAPWDNEMYEAPAGNAVLEAPASNGIYEAPARYTWRAELYGSDV